MGNEANRLEAHKSSSTIRAQATSKLPIVGAEASTSSTEYEKRKTYVHVRIASSIVNAFSSIPLTTYERRKTDACTTYSIVNAETSTEYERRKTDARTTYSIVNAEASTVYAKYERRKWYARTTSSIVNAFSTTLLKKFERRKMDARTTDYSIVNAEASTLYTEYESRNGSKTISTVSNAETSTSSIEYENRQANALTFETTEGVVEFEEAMLEDVQPKAGQFKGAAFPPPPTDPITLIVEEEAYVWVNGRYDDIVVEVEGTLSLQILNREDGFIQLQVDSDVNPDILFTYFQYINKELFLNENILGRKDPNKPFPSCQATGEKGVAILRWKLNSLHKSIVPFTIDCESFVFKNENYAKIKYIALRTLDMQNVIISVRLRGLYKHIFPRVKKIDGEWRYDSNNSTLEWSINDPNQSGLMVFVVPRGYSILHYPISVQFTATKTFSGFKVLNILPLRDEPPPKFVQRNQLSTTFYE